MGVRGGSPTLGKISIILSKSDLKIVKFKKFSKIRRRFFANFFKIKRIILNYLLLGDSKEFSEASGFALFSNKYFTSFLNFFSKCMAATGPHDNSTTYDTRGLGRAYPPNDREIFKFSRKILPNFSNFSRHFYSQWNNNATSQRTKNISYNSLETRIKSKRFS